MPTHIYRRIWLLLLAATAACHSRAYERSGALAPRLSTPTYDGTVSVDPATRAVNADWRINFRRTANTADSVTLLLNRSLAVTRLTGTDVKSFAERIDEGLKHLTVHLAPVSRRDSVSTIEIAYNGVPGFGTDTINGISERWIELGLDSFWHPVFSDFSQSILANVRLNVPSGMTPITSGSVTRNSGTVELVSTVPLIDIPFVASPDIREVKGDRVTVYHSAQERPELVSKTLSTTTACAKYLDERYSTAQRPMAPVKMVVAPRGGPGYARKNYIVITRTADTATVPLTRFICHELAHFWSSGAVSSGPENWLNEGFAEFVSARYVRAIFGEDAYTSILTQWQSRANRQPAIWTPESRRRPMPGTSYGKAPYLLHRLEERIGTPAMEKILVRYMRESIATTPSLIALVDEIAGAETAAWFREQLAI